MLKDTEFVLKVKISKAWKQYIRHEAFGLALCFVAVIN
jgi:hypothetical protein